MPNVADSGFEAGIAPDVSVVVDSGPDELVVEPHNRMLTVDFTAPTSHSVTYSVFRDAAEITAALSLDDPSLGTFAGSVLSTAVPLPFSEVGRTFVITAREGGKRGRAKLTLVRLRATDFLFSSPTGVAPAPDKELFRVLTSSASGADVSVVLKNDPANPPGVDARKLVTVRAMSEGWAKIEPPSCEPQATRDSDGDGLADTFVAVTTARALCFDVRPVTNVLVPAGESASFHRVIVDVVTSTGKTLHTHTVVVMVPPSDPVPR